MTDDVAEAQRRLAEFARTKDPAALWPGVEWLIVGVSKQAEEPEVRNYLIEDGKIRDAELEVT